MKADRIAKVVQKTFIAGLEPGEVYKPENWNLMGVGEVERLLRLEQAYQLARVRRLIKAESARLARMEMTSREGKAWITAKQNVLAVILAALNRRTP